MSLYITTKDTTLFWTWNTFTVVLMVFMEKGQTANESLHDYDDVILTIALDVNLTFYDLCEHQELHRNYPA